MYGDGSSIFGRSVAKKLSGDQMLPKSGLSVRTSSSGAGPGARSVGGMQNPIADAYDAAAERFRMSQKDPYAELAARETDMGYRYPDAYSAAAAAATQVPWMEKPARAVEAPPPDLLPWIGPQATVPARGWAGQRITSFGTSGVDLKPWPTEWDARHKMGFIPTGSRDAGYSPEWDTPDRHRRVSGRLEGLQTQDQHVFKERPWLSLRAANGTCHVRLTAGMSGGMEAVREFFVGRGWTCTFMLAEYDHLKIEILEIDAVTTQLQYAWLGDGMQAGDQNLYLPQKIVLAQVGVPQPVPEAAYGVYTSIFDVAWTWTTPLIGNTQASGIASSAVGATIPVQFNAVLGVFFTPSIINDVVWVLRTI